MQCKYDFTLIKLDQRAYTKDVKDALAEQLKKGVDVWIRAALAIIPFWSGASWGTFIKLARRIGSTFALSGSGVAWLSGPPYGESKSKGTLIVTNQRVVAEYATTLFHLVYNEYNNANAAPREESRLFAKTIHPTPYHFQEKANTAYLAFMKTLHLPPITSYLKKQRIHN